MARRQSLNSFKSIDQILNTENEFTNLRESVKNYNIVEEFIKIFPEMKKVTQAVKVEKQILFLRVENSVWKSELNLRKNLIAERINKYFGEKVVKTIKFL